MSGYIESWAPLIARSNEMKRALAEQLRVQMHGGRSMPMPDGWERKVENGPEVTYSNGVFFVTASDGCVEVGDASAQCVYIEDADQVDALISILRRAWRQHEHLKAGAGEPLGEEEEEA